MTAADEYDNHNTIGPVALGGAPHLRDTGHADGGDMSQRDDRSPLQLEPSVEPSIVFTRLAAQSVPQVCDECTIDIVDGTNARYRIAHPPRSTRAGGLLRIADRAEDAADHTVRIPFAHQYLATASTPADARSDESAGGRGAAGRRDDFHGVATFVWHRRSPSIADRTMSTLLVDHAVHLVVSQRNEQAAAEATTKAAHLQVALQTSRDIGAAIGILMSLHKITRDQAFALLRQVSQESNRAIRDLALEVIDTGWLNPTYTMRARSSSGATRTTSE